MKVFRTLVMALFLAGSFGGSATASPIYADPYDSSSSPGGLTFVPVTNNLYASFSTGSSAFSLTDVVLFLSPTPSTPRTGSFQANLYADNGTSPGLLIGSIGTAVDSYYNYNSPYTNGTIHWHPSYELAANTRYWVGLTNDNSSVNRWASVDSMLYTSGVVGEYHVVGGQRYDNSAANGAFVLSVHGVEVEIIPEPSTYALLCISLGVVGYARKRMGRTGEA